MNGVFFDGGILAEDFLNSIFLMVKDLKFSLGRLKEFYWGLRQLQKVLLGFCLRRIGPPQNNIWLKSKRNIAFKVLPVANKF